jgi:iron complex outermembrane receptor protein
MQSAFNQQPKLRLSLIAVACQLACLSLSANAQTAQEAATAPKAEVVITGKKLGMGLMVIEDAPRTRSTITAEELEKQRPTGNAYQALEMMPAVNSYNHDATGLYGGGLTIRGFNSDQLGVTINGAPVNDSGSFSVFPQEYVDQENTCTEFVTQGSADVDAPQVGASGGNFGITTCQPEDVRRVRVMQSVGQLAMSKTYVRFDTGRLSDNRTKAFISFSNAQADKWKGPGSAKRDHIDLGLNYDWDRFNFIHGTVLYNKAFNNNYLSFSLADLKAKGYNYDYSPAFTGQLKPVNGTVQNESVPTPAYSGLSVNPFKNAVVTVTGKARITENLDIKVLPYYWYGLGTGGTQEQKITESKLLNRATGTLTAGTDINGDGDTLDTVIVDDGSITRTSRPGITTSLLYTIGDHAIVGGFWYERANHEQTAPAVRVDANGVPAGGDYYQQTGQILRLDGSPYMFRDAKTLSTVKQLFLQDTITMFNDKAQINLGVRAPQINRNFINYANEGSNAASQKTYMMERTYKDVLPNVGVRYRVTSDDQIYTSLTKNMKAPPNFVFFPSNSNVTLVNGVPTLTSPVEKEVSWDFELGFRHQTADIVASVSAFAIDFRDRQANATNPATLVSALVNVGKVKLQGVELELGTTPKYGWSFYSSLGYIHSETMSDLLVPSLPAGKTVSLPLSGKEFPLTPKLKANLSAEYQDGAAWGRLKARATSKQQATLMNDETVPGYTILDFDAGYTFANYGLLKRPKLTFNLSNILSRQYRNPTSQGTTNAVGYTNAAGVVAPAKTVFYYMGAPRFASLTLSVDY